MKKKSKALLVLLSAVALVVTTMLGTMAYLTDTESVKNTFTVGKVGITLDEAPVGANGKEIAGTRVTENKYHLIPGQTYDKDPTIHVAADSEDCYLFVQVVNNIAAIETKEEGKTIEDQMEANGWKAVEGVDNLYVLATNGEKRVVSKNDEDVIVFENFTIDGDTVDNTKIADFAGKEIVVTAYAVQKAGFETNSPAEIWKATFGK